MQKDKHNEPSGKHSSRRHNRTHVIRLSLLCLFAAIPAPVRAQAPVFEITPQVSTIKFDVEASVSIKGTFDKWDATLTFPSTDVTKGVLEIKIQADSVDTGSGMKNGKLKSKNFFDVKQNPLITFKSTKIAQTGRIRLKWMAILRYVELLSPRSYSLLSPGKGRAQVRSKG